MPTFGTRYRTATVDGLEVVYREAGNPDRPTLVLLQGFPSSLHMFRNLIDALADEFHLIAPDHIGFGRSAMPAVTEFEYSFDKLTEITEGLLEQLGGPRRPFRRAGPRCRRAHRAPPRPQRADRRALLPRRADRGRITGG